MNAYFRVTSYLEGHKQEFPKYDDIRVDLMREADAVAVLKATARATANADIAPEFIEGLQYLERFNLRAADMSLFVDDDPLPGVPDEHQQRRSEFQRQAARTCATPLPPTASTTCRTWTATLTSLFWRTKRCRAGNLRMATMLKHCPWWFACFGEIATPLINWW